MNYPDETRSQCLGNPPHRLPRLLVLLITRIFPCTLWLNAVVFGLIGTSSYADLIAESSVNGITVEFKLSDLQVTSIEQNGVKYQPVSYEGCGFTSEEGNPHLPVSRILLGVPANTSFSVEVLHASNETRTNHRLPPVPYRLLPREPDVLTQIHDRGWPEENVPAPTEEWREDGTAYQTGALFPASFGEGCL